MGRHRNPGQHPQNGHVCYIFAYGRRHMIQIIWDYSCQRHIYEVSVLGDYNKRNLVMSSTVEPCLTEIPFIRTTTSSFPPLHSGPYLLTCLLCNFRTSMKLRSVARIFQMGAGSHCVKVRLSLSCRFYHRLWVVCSKKAYTRGGGGGTGAPGSPGYASERS